MIPSTHSSHAMTWEISSYITNIVYILGNADTKYDVLFIHSWVLNNRQKRKPCYRREMPLKISQWWKQEQSVKTKTKTKTKTIRSRPRSRPKLLRPRPRARPIKQQWDYITKKFFCCNTHFCYKKITLCRKRQKWHDDQLRLALYLHLLHEKI